MTARNTQEAVDVLTVSPNVIAAILDFSIPGGTAEDLVNAVLEHRPGLFLVGHSGEFRAHEFRQLGVDRFLLKPWTVAELMQVVQVGPSHRPGDAQPSP